MADEILGFQRDNFYGLMLLILLIILGIVSFNYYIIVNTGGTSALRAKTGVGFAILPKKN